MNRSTEWWIDSIRIFLFHRILRLVLANINPPAPPVVDNQPITMTDGSQFIAPTNASTPVRNTIGFSSTVIGNWMNNLCFEIVFQSVSRMASSSRRWCCRRHTTSWHANTDYRSCSCSKYEKIFENNRSSLFLLAQTHGLGNLATWYVYSIKCFFFSTHVFFLDLTKYKHQRIGYVYHIRQVYIPEHYDWQKEIIEIS